MKNKKGFTLIELIVVLAILAVIAAIAVPTAFGSIEKANVAADKASIDGLNSAIRMAAVIEKGDAAIMSMNATDAEAKPGATKIADAVVAAQFDTNSKMLSKGSVSFIAATETTIASFHYNAEGEKTPPDTVEKSLVKGAVWADIIKTAPYNTTATCNYFVAKKP